MEIWTVGHSTRTLEDFVELLHGHGIKAVADVRRFPGSKRHPHFAERPLATGLARIGVEYHSFRDLGGRRKPSPDSRNTLWKNAAFRGYADYMETDEFGKAVERLLQLASAKRTAILCAEALWWRCHRALISDYLKSSDVLVNHIVTSEKSELHPYTSAARIVDGRLSYSDRPEQTLFG